MLHLSLLNKMVFFDIFANWIEKNVAFKQHENGGMKYNFDQYWLDRRDAVASLAFDPQLDIEKN